MKVSELKQLALLKLQGQIPKTKKELEAFVLGEKKETAKEVKEVQSHLKAKKCKVVAPEELEGLQSHKEAVKHLKGKKCPETETVAKKAYVSNMPVEKAEKPARKPRAKKEYTEEQKQANREKMERLRAMRGKGKAPAKEAESESESDGEMVY